jgi:hypothetical protein
VFVTTLVRPSETFSNGGNSGSFSGLSGAGACAATNAGSARRKDADQSERSRRRSDMGTSSRTLLFGLFPLDGTRVSADEEVYQIAPKSGVRSA